MKTKMGFEQCHPAVNLIYFAAVNFGDNRNYYDGCDWTTSRSAMESYVSGLPNNPNDFGTCWQAGLRGGYNLADEARTDSFISDSTMTDSMLVTNAFGQNFDATMIQMVTGFCSLINGGYYYEPHVVKKITSPSGTTLKTIEPRVLKQTVS